MTIHSTAELYGMFLDSRWWWDLSLRKRRGIRKCEKCGSRFDLQCHHIRYPENWFDTRLEDLVVLCRVCHEKEHGISEVKFTPNTPQQAREWRHGNRKRAYKAIPRRFRKTRRQRIKEQRRKERRVGLDRLQWNPRKTFRITPRHHYVNRGNSSN